MADAPLRDVLSRWAAQPRPAVIFDFNGTLSDDEPILLEIFDEIFDEHLGAGLSPEEYYGRLAGLSDREIVERVVASRACDAGLVDELLRQRHERYREKIAQRSPIREATAELVRRLARGGVPMGVVTGAQRPDVTFVLDRSPVGRHMSVIVTEEDVTKGKPDPEGFLLGARLLGREPHEILVFEDSQPGVEGARAAGMRCVAVTGDQHDSLLRRRADAVAQDFGDVLTHVPAS